MKVGKGVRGAGLDTALDALLEQWEKEPAMVRPITVKAVAQALRVSRTSLYKDKEQPHSRQARIRAAAARQEKHDPMAVGAQVLTYWRDRLRRVEEERDVWKKRWEDLQERILGMEYHANMYGWDASLLWQPLPTNNREERGRAPSGRHRRNRPWDRGREMLSGTKVSAPARVLDEEGENGDPFLLGP